MIEILSIAIDNKEWKNEKKRNSQKYKKNDSLI